MKPILLALLASAALAAPAVRVVDSPEVPAVTSRHYVFNRAPLAPAPMAKLPLGSVQPRGWVAGELALMVTGMTGRLTELSKFLRPENGWFGGDNEGWEEQPYWFLGFHDLAEITGDARLKTEAARWVEAVIGSQTPDGYFGARLHRSVTGKNDGVSRTCGLTW